MALSSQSLSQVSECLLFDLVEEWSLKFSNGNYNTKSTNLISGLLARLERCANNAKVAGSRPAWTTLFFPLVNFFHAFF